MVCPTTPAVRGLLCLLAATAPFLCHAQIAGAAAAGNTTERLAACQDYQLPAEYEPYLNTSFLGDRQYIQVDTVNTSYYAFGPLGSAEEGRPLVLIAGQGATISIWGPDLLNSLAQNRPVVIFDTRGIGYSTDTSTESYTIGLFAESTVAFIEALDLDQPDVLGWSQGGFVGLHMAANYSSAINRLVLADTAVSGMAFAETAAGQQLAEALDTSLPYVRAGSQLPPTLIYPDEDAGNEGLCRLLVFSEAMPADQPTEEQILRQAAVLLDFVSNSSSDANFVYDSLSDFTTPVLLIAGQQDLILPVAADRTIAELVPGATIVEYPDAGHAAILQHSLTSAAIVADFLDGRPIPENPSLYSLNTASPSAS